MDSNETQSENLIYYSQENRYRDKGASNSGNKVRSFDARWVSKSILKEILNEIHKVNHREPPIKCRIIKRKTETSWQTKIMPESKKEPIPLEKSSSMSSLIIWNISKALQVKSSLDLKASITAAKERLDSDARELSAINEKHPEQQYVLCALLAWQQLGHQNADSLYNFVEPKMKEMSCAAKCMSKSNSNYQDDEEINSGNVFRNAFVWKSLKPSGVGSFGSHTSGPLLALPTTTMLNMRLDNQPVHKGCQHATTSSVGTSQQPVRETVYSLDAVCGMGNECVKTLAALELKSNELRTRSGQLALRERDRSKLLERAEVAWMELEAGYQKRLANAEEKEHDLEKKVKTMIVERNKFKSNCKTLTDDLELKKEAVEKVKDNLTAVEKEVCSLAKTKMSTKEEAAKSAAALSQELAKAGHYDRDLKFKEEQAIRKLERLQNEADSAQALASDRERAMRAELSALRQQVVAVDKQLLAEDVEGMKIKEEQEKLRMEKNGMVEDLSGCKATCDKKMQNKLDDLLRKKEKLLELQEQVIECKCKMPQDAVVQVKRTPSLAAMCRCDPKDHLQESCSCTSMRTKLLSNLLSDLFGGLQAELGDAGSRMPCQLLKCLEDKHNWDCPSVIKSNLRNFFSKLLKNELNIAIANVIENYHAKWVGTTCADEAKMIPTLEDDLKEGWQERAIERRAQKLANKLVMDLYQDRANQFNHQQANDMDSSGQQNSNCPPTQQTAMFPCLMPLNSAFNPASTTNSVNRLGRESPPAFWKKTIQDVTELKLQIEYLQKESLKKEDLKVMEDNIFKVVTDFSVIDNEDPLGITRDTSNLYGESIKKEIKNSRDVSRSKFPKNSNQNKLGAAKRKDGNSLFKKVPTNEKPTKQSKKQVHGQSYAVNLCLCGPQTNDKSLQNTRLNKSERSTRKLNSLKDVMPQSTTVKKIKPINISLPSPELQEDESKISEPCGSNCKCFRKSPSNASIDRLLQTLVSWKYDLVSQEKYTRNIKNSFSKCSKTIIKETMRNNDQKCSKNIYSTSTTSNNKKQVNDSDINNDTLSMKADQEQRSYLKQPIITESEYMGTVYLDKSQENICKCIANIQSGSHEIYGDGKENIPFQCINTNTCDCKIHQEMEKDHKRSQTDEPFKVQIQSNQCHVALSKDYPEFVENQSNLKNSNNKNNQKELHSSSSEYYIKFLGITLDDLSSDKNIKGKIENVDYNTGGLLPKDKHPEHPRNVSITERNDQFGLNDCTKCKCKAKLEEFTSLMNNIFDNKLQENSHKDVVIDSKTSKNADKIIESCECCGIKEGDSGDLEVNAFHLLEDHIKEKIYDLKKHSCIPQEAEEKLFSTISERVKQVISDCANKLRCGCRGGLPNNGSWNRAYGLLQEYLKIKIKRVQCLCVLNDSKDKDLILPEVLEKVCNLIDNDIKRLKDICTCSNNTETRTKSVRIGDRVLPPAELPEKDTNTSQVKYNDCKIQNFSVVSKFSKQTSNNSMIVKENISSQVPPDLGMEAKSCNIMEPPKNKRARTTETESIITDSKSNGVMYNTCDCCYNTDKVDIRKFPDMFETKEVLVNVFTEQAVNTSDIFELPITGIHQKTSRYPLAGGVESMKAIPKRETSKKYEYNLDAQKRVINKRVTPGAPYIGYTVDCSCDSALGPCFCMKSLLQSNNDKIDNIWKEFLANDNKTFPYIMHGTQNKNSDYVVNCRGSEEFVLDETSKNAVMKEDDLVTCEDETSAENEEVFLKGSLETASLTQHATNTIDQSSNWESAFSNSDIDSVDWIKSPLPPISGRSNAINLTKSIYFPGTPIDIDRNSFISGIAIDSGFQTQKTTTCGCDKVPICHVKMLVKHIEKNLLESKCTCDSLISKVCPVHSRRVF